MRTPTILGSTTDEPDDPHPPVDDPRGVTVAAILRRRAASEALWIDVTGASMGSSIPDGAKVLVEPAMHPRRGEIWAFCLLDATIVVHRFRRGVGDRLRFQGDARPVADDLVDPAQLVGRVTQVAIGPAIVTLGTRSRLVARLRLDLTALRLRLARLGQRG